MKREAFVLAAALLLPLLACKKDETKSEAAVTPSVATALPAPSASVAAEPAKPKGLFEDQIPDGLAPLDLSPLDVPTMKKSTDTDTKAATARKAKQYAKATELYLEALKTDPGNRPARYNLARTLILDDKHDAGLAVLDQLYRVEEQCWRCEGLLLRAAQEKDFGAVHDRPEFKERTSLPNVGKTLPKFEPAAKMVLGWLGNPTMDNLPPLVDSRTFIILQRKGSAFKMFKGAQAFVDYVQDKSNFPNGRKWGGVVGPPMGMSYKCPNECCEISSYDPPGRRNLLQRMCFKAQGGVAVALNKLVVSD